MKKLLLFVAFLLLAACAAYAQTERFDITYSGWGRIETGLVMGAPVGRTLSELDIHRWRKTQGEAVLERGERQLTLRLPRKEIVYALLTDSYTHPAKDGWSYVEHQALENDRTYCRVWDCTHEDGSRQILVLYPTFVQGYKITPAE